MRWSSTQFAGAAFLTASLWLAPGLARSDAMEGQGGVANDPKAAHAQTDENADGQINHEEFLHRMTEVFYFSDENRNGYLEASEFGRSGVQDVGAGDANGDGKVSLNEFMEDSFDRFEAADANGNGMLSLPEVEAAYSARTP